MGLFGRMAGKGIALTIVSLVVVVFLGLLVGWAAVTGSWIFSKTTAEPRGQTEVREDTVADGDYRIAQYEHFYDLCASVQSKEAQIRSLQQELAEGDPTEARRGQIQASLTPLRSARETLINQYNADARKEGTAAQFKASDLPDELDPDEEETTCTAES